MSLTTLQFALFDGEMLTIQAADDAQGAHLVLLAEILGVELRNAPPLPGGCRLETQPFNSEPDAESFIVGSRAWQATFAADGHVEIRAIDTRILPLERRAILAKNIFYCALLPALRHGGCRVIHGAGALRNGGGILLCGRSGVGKSTAAARLAAAGTGWSVPADDCWLLKRSAAGTYRVLPLPTWSHWTSGKPAPFRFRPVPAVTLERIYLLDRGDLRLEPLPPPQRRLALSECLCDMVTWNTLRFRDSLRRELMTAAWEEALRLADAFPVQRLCLNLTARFEPLLETSALTVAGELS